MQNVIPPDLDGLRWRMIASDGNQAGEINVNLSTSEILSSEILAGNEIPVMTLIQAVERRAGDYPTERRLELLLQSEHLKLRGSDFRDSDFEFNPDPASSP